MRIKISAIFILLVLTISLVSASELSKNYLCQKSYLSLKSNTSSESLVQEILYEKNIGVSVETINSYKSNFESFCSSELNIILNPSYLCQRIYYLILSENYNFNNDDLLKISNQTNTSVGIVQNYIVNNYDTCYLSGLSKKLPEIEYEKIYLNDTKCELNQDSFLGAIPLNIELGKKDCSKITFWNNFFVYEETNGFFSLKGIRLIYAILPIFIILTFFVFSSIRKSNKLIKKELKR